MPVERFSKDDFEKALKSVREEWFSNFTNGEWRYHTHFGENGTVFVNSSVGVDGYAKSVGEDSIRVWVQYSGKALKKSQRWVTRVPGWQDRLVNMIKKAFKIITDMDYSPKCPDCGGAMVIRSGVHGRFYGCLKFPRCRGTRPYEEYKKETLWES